MTPEELEDLPPYDIETEMCALGAALLSGDAAIELVEKATAEDFFRSTHRAMLAAIGSLIDRSEPVTAQSVRLEMFSLRAGKEYVPDAVYLHSLMEKVPAAASIGFWIRDLKNITKLRNLVELAPALAQLGRGTAPSDADTAVDEAQRLIDRALTIETASTAKSAAELIGPFMERLQFGRDKRGITTGWKDLDRLISKARPGQLIIVAGRPGMGKSVAMACMAYHVAFKLNLPALIGTLEMSNDEFLARLVSMDCKVPLQHLLDDDAVTEEDWGRLTNAHNRFIGAETLILDDDPGMGISHIKARLREMRRRGNPAAVAFVDYLQLMEGTRRSENRQVEVSGFSRALKLMAKEFQIPIVVGAQLNRDVEKRQDKKPLISDLRESGSLEQDADVVILLHREDYYDKESPRSGEIDMIVGKNRSGPQATVVAAFQGHYSRIADMASEDRVPGYADPSEPRSPRH